MTAYYTRKEADHLRCKAEERGECVDLVRCSDGVLRTSEDAAKFEEKYNNEFQAKPLLKVWL